ncbi:MAG TPA: hypothetical protein VGO03_07525 [Acidimicrobiia bacterium]|jgi:archaellum component FlaG (FlaF/FlaG flagellin family)
MTTTPLSGVSRPETGSKTDEAKEALTHGASEVAGEMKDQATSFADSTKQAGVEVARDAKEHVQDVVGQTRDQLRAQANDQMHNLAETVHAIAQQLDGLTSGQPQPGMVLDVANQLASNAHTIGDHLEQGGMEAVVGDVKQFARQRPGMFLAASLVGGMLAGRMLRSTDTRQLAQSVKDAASGGGESEPAQSGSSQPGSSQPAPSQPGSSTPLPGAVGALGTGE